MHLRQMQQIQLRYQRQGTFILTTQLHQGQVLNGHQQRQQQEHRIQHRLIFLIFLYNLCQLLLLHLRIDDLIDLCLLIFFLHIIRYLLMKLIQQFIFLDLKLGFFRFYSCIRASCIRIVKYLNHNSKNDNQLRLNNIPVQKEES